MLPIVAIPLALPQDKEQELAEEFELDIRVSSMSVPTLIPDRTNHSCSCSCTNCTCNTCHIVGTRCLHG